MKQNLGMKLQGCRPRLAWSDLAVGGGALPASVAAVGRDAWPASVALDASVPILAGAEARAKLVLAAVAKLR